jgi:type IV secretion system protein VirD4
MQNRNKLRKSNNKKIWFQMGAILFILVLVFMLYATYIYLCYTAENDVSEIDYNTIMELSAMLTSPTFSIPLTVDLIGELFYYQAVKLWFIYAGVIIIVYLIATSRVHNDYRGIEKGSASWEDVYALKEFSDTTGIPQANKFYATIDNPKKKSYKPHNLNEIVIGGSGAGKSFRKIKPDIIQMFASYVVTDPKGIIYKGQRKSKSSSPYFYRRCV